MLFRSQPVPEPPAEWELDTEEARVQRWRVAQLCTAGLLYDHACAIASSGADYHEALRLIDKGCPTHLVAGILA